jgi:DNA recombination protein RmuC
MPRMSEWLVPALLGLILMLLLWLVLRRGDRRALKALGDGLKQDAERLERELRTEVQDSARGTRQELAGTLSLFQQTLLAQSGDVARTQNEQIDSGPNWRRCSSR